MGGGQEDLGGAGLGLRVENHCGVGRKSRRGLWWPMGRRDMEDWQGGGGRGEGGGGRKLQTPRPLGLTCAVSSTGV